MTTKATISERTGTVLNSQGTLLQALLEQITDTVVICDAKGRIAWANPSAKRLFQTDPIGTTFDMIPSVWGEAYDSAGQRIPPDQWALPRALRGETRDFECHMILHNGSPVDLHVTAAPIRQPDGAIIAAVSIARDITHRKQSEERLKMLYAEEQRLRRESETQSLRTAQFLRALIHELKTPLTPMLGASDMLVGQLQDESLRRIAINISRGAQNLNRRLNDLVDLAKGEIGILQLKYEMVDTREMLHEILDYVTPEADRKQLSLSLEAQDCLPTVAADGDRLRQILFNLLNNALKYTRPGGRIALKARATDTELIFEVSDTGCGISRKDQRRLFEPIRLMRGEDRPIALGIGLPLSKMLAGLHGGQIWVKSRKGRGSSFGFSIPLKPNPGPRAEMG